MEPAHCFHRFNPLSALAAATLFLLVGCRAGVIFHNEGTAARAATEFAQAAFVAQDFPRAYPLLSTAFRAKYSEAAFTQSVRAMHPAGWPQSVRATSYEPVPGANGLSVFLEGQGADPAVVFYYRLSMEGNALVGYRPTGLYRRGEPYPSNPSRRPLHATSSSRTWPSQRTLHPAS